MYMISQHTLATADLGIAVVLLIVSPFLARRGYTRTHTVPQAKRTWTLFGVGCEFLAIALMVFGIESYFDLIRLRILSELGICLALLSAMLIGYSLLHIGMAGSDDNNHS